MTESRPLPTLSTDIDGPWVEMILRSTGLLGSGRVLDVTVEPIGVGVGLLGLLYRVTPTYEDAPQAPVSLVAKLPTNHAPTRAVARVFRFYEKEVSFYQTLADRSPLHTPNVFVATYAPDTDDFVLLLEDVGHLRSGDQVAGCSPEDARLAVVGLARHHAAFWNDPRFAEPQLSWLPFGHDAPTPQGVEQGLADSWPIYEELFGATLDPTVARAAGYLRDHVSELLAADPEHPVTAIHGDYRLDNLFFHPAGAVTALDWQLVVKGPPAYDLAYFISQSLTVDTRREHGDAIITAYRSTLADAGVAYDDELFWRAFRRTLVFCLVYPIQACSLDLSDPRARQLVGEMFARVGQAIIDYDALSACDD